MRRRSALLAVVGALVALMLASCGGDDERYPPFEMTYTVTQGQGGSQQTWELDYRAADDWTKTVVAASEDSNFPVGRTARWNGDRIAWAESPDGRFVEDGSPEANPNHALPERWFGYNLDDLPNEFFEEVEAQEPGTRRFRNEFPVGETVWTEVVTFDGGTGFPLRYEMSEPDVVHTRFEVVELDLRQ